MALAIIFVAVIVASVALASIPVPQRVTYQISTSSFGGGSYEFNYSYPQSLCRTGARASVSYTASPTVSLVVQVFAPNGTTLWTSNSNAANATFTVPVCGNYAFDLGGSGNGTVSLSIVLTYRASYL
ncbi:MAG: hypothetical protein ACRECT_08170 [Thermoplasmata archaeon]